MADDVMDTLEAKISELRLQVRRALASGDRAAAAALRAELREAEFQWDEALHVLAAPASVPTGRRLSTTSGSLLPVREQVHQALTLLGVAAAPKLITAVHEAFFAGDLAGTQLTYLRRDEERSFRSSPHGRPYYLCSALTSDRLTPVRGLLAVSTWPMGRRIIGSLSPRVDFLTAAIRVAEHLERAGEPGPQGQRLLWRFAENIPGAAGPFDSGKPAAVADAARTELAIHDADDRLQREAAARRARQQLDDAQQLFGAAPMGVVRTSSSA